MDALGTLCLRVSRLSDPCQSSLLRLIMMKTEDVSIDTVRTTVDKLVQSPLDLAEFLQALLTPYPSASNSQLYVNEEVVRVSLASSLLYLLVSSDVGTWQLDYP